jgi:hypothetical protein
LYHLLPPPPIVANGIEGSALNRKPFKGSIRVIRTEEEFVEVIPNVCLELPEAVTGPVDGKLDDEEEDQEQM